MIDGECIECSDNCIHCKGDECSLCEKGWLIALDGTCTQDCGEGNYADDTEGVCVECHDACTLCYGGSIDECTACVDGHFKEDGEDGCNPCDK